MAPRSGMAAHVLTVLLLCMACKDNRAQTVLRMEAKDYQIKALTQVHKAGQSATTKLLFVPKAGFKWNIKFPSRLKVLSAGTLNLDKSKFKKADFKLEGERAYLQINFVPKAAGKTAVRATGNFSVCNDKSCRIFRNEEIQWEVETAP